MTRDDLEILYTEYETSYKQRLLKKNKEYTPELNVLANFQEAARLSHTTPLSTLRGMWIKHIISINHMINDMEEDYHRTTEKARHHPANHENMEKWDEKIGDNIIYSYLMLAMLEELK